MHAIARGLALCCAVATSLVALSVAAPRADADPASLRADVDLKVRVITQASIDERMASMVARRAHALGAIDRQATAHDRALAGRQAVLALYGYFGDPDQATRVLPLASYSMSAGFGRTGPLWEDRHGGQDFGASAGEVLVAVSRGTVTEVGEAGPYGLRTVLTLEDGTEVWYCHQTSLSVTAGQVVDLADVIGYVGSTGNSIGPHLHLEVRPDAGDPIDPMEWFGEAGLNP